MQTRVIVLLVGTLASSLLAAPAEAGHRRGGVVVSLSSGGVYADTGGYGPTYLRGGQGCRPMPAACEPRRADWRAPVRYARQPIVSRACATTPVWVPGHWSYSDARSFARPYVRPAALGAPCGYRRW